jgi:hypothetical protein
LEESGTNQLRCLEGFEVKDLGSIELIYEELLSIGVISYKVSDLIYKRKGNSNDFKDFLQVLSLQILKFFEG